MSDWILVVDDDTSNLRMASRILSAEQMRVSCLKSGEDALAFLHDNRPDLILLDVHMPGMDGFETLASIRSDHETADIPVIFLTADDDSNTETRGLEAGAKDFIKKPFVPEVLLLRVRTALSGAIDAKDTYTNGHSTRVAEYSGEIAKRAGFAPKMQNDIYMMGLLHDVGKIGVPDAIINKPAHLTEEEFAVIRNHPVMGARILKNIKDFPKLITGARWHHERYDGKGYPDGIAGEEIPLEARIIAVADAYDAMSSRRSYRDVLPQETVRLEIEKGKGTQFDPVMTKIVLSMMDDDADYQMRER